MTKQEVTKLEEQEKPKLGRPVSIKKKESILKAAQYLFHKYGFDGVTMDEIAKRAGVVKATLYNQFKDKENLFIEMMKGAIQGLENDVDVEKMMAGKEIEEILNEVGKGLVTFIESDEVRNSQKLMVMQSGQHKKLAQLFLQNGPFRIRKLVIEILEKAKERGEISVENCQEKASYFMMMLINMNSFEMMMGLSKKRNKDSVEKDVKNAVNFFLKAIR